MTIFKDTTTKTPPQHHKKNDHNTTKTPPQKHHHTTKTPPREHHHKNTTTSILPQFSTVVGSPQKTPPHHHENTTTTPPQKHHHILFTRVYHRSRVQSGQKRPIWRSFFTVVRFRSKTFILPQFWASDTHEVTRGLPGSAEEFAFYTTVLRVRHARSDERVARRREKFVFNFTTVLRIRHARSDETGARAGARLRILQQFWASDTHEVT